MQCKNGPTKYLTFKPKLYTSKSTFAPCKLLVSPWQCLCESFMTKQVISVTTKGPRVLEYRTTHPLIFFASIFNANVRSWLLDCNHDFISAFNTSFPRSLQDLAELCSMQFCRVNLLGNMMLRSDISWLNLSVVVIFDNSL